MQTLSQRRRCDFSKQPCMQKTTTNLSTVSKAYELILSMHRGPPIRFQWRKGGRARVRHPTIRRTLLSLEPHSIEHRKHCHWGLSTFNGTDEVAETRLQYGRNYECAACWIISAQFRTTVLVWRVQVIPALCKCIRVEDGYSKASYDSTEA